MQLRRTAVALTIATLGATLLSSAPAQAGIKVPQTPQAGVIIHDVAGYPPGPTRGGAAAE
ncbi:hypothetical protein GCM10009839_36870 [Catenulispora yoronensis]|uniref:Uncharacterized protein n=1 Tax=Catenulispora yoronensis TaxID=450799 RepID=A0ABP5FSM2_9ACTN